MLPELQSGSIIWVRDINMFVEEAPHVSHWCVPRRWRSPDNYHLFTLFEQLFMSLQVFFYPSSSASGSLFCSLFLLSFGACEDLFNVVYVDDRRPILLCSFEHHVNEPRDVLLALNHIFSNYLAGQVEPHCWSLVCDCARYECLSDQWRAVQ